LSSSSNLLMEDVSSSLFCHCLCFLCLFLCTIIFFLIPPFPSIPLFF
jgi:hypothetical protein